MTTIEKKIGCKIAGKGGVKCRCCGPSTGEDTKRFRRQVKRGKVKEHVRKEVKEQLDKE